jgi:hypothetical protein
MRVCVNTVMRTVNWLKLMLFVLIALSILCLGCGLYDPGFNFCQRHLIFISKTLSLALGPIQPHWGLATQLPPLSLDARVLFLGLKWTVYKVDCSSTFNAKFKNDWSRTSLFCTCPCGLHKDEFYFYHAELIFSLTYVLKGIFLTVWLILTWHWHSYSKTNKMHL